MNIKLKEINSYAREVMIDLPWDEIEQDFANATKKFSKRVKLPGFRPPSNAPILSRLLP